MTLLPDFTPLTSTPTVALVCGRVLRADAPAMATALHSLLRELGAKPKSKPQFAAFDAGEGLTAVGYVTARAPLAFADRVRVRHATIQLASAGFDEATVEVGDRDARTAIDMAAALEKSGIARAEVAASVAARPEDPKIHEPELYLAGAGRLVWGRLLMNDGADYEKGRVQTFRSTFNGDVVRIVGVTLAEASPGKPMRVASDADMSLEAFRREASALIAAELEAKDMGLYLVAT